MDYHSEHMDTSSGIQPIHPLLIDHVVENVLEYLDSELLGHHCKIFRLVCKDWCRIATKVYKTKRGKITFKKNFIGRVSGLFIRVMKTSLDIPFEKFAFCSDSYDNEYFDELLHVCSGAITSLELNLVNPCNLIFPKRFPHLVLNRLKTLVFHVRIESRGPLQLQMPSLLEALIEAVPNIETLDLKVFGGIPRSLENAPNYPAIMRRFGDIITQHPPKKLKHLKLNITLTDDQLNALTCQGLKLRSLEVYFQQSQFSKRTMEKYLSVVAPDLLKVKAIGNQFLMDIKFPQFSNLRHLIAMGKAPRTVEYDKLFPRLDQLEICLFEDDRDVTVFADNCFSKSVTHVFFPFVVTSAEVYNKMGKCFPNLKKLTGITIGSAEGMKMIFKSLKTLEILEITLGYEFHELNSVDSVFTGIAPAIAGAILKYKEYKDNFNFGVGESLNNLTELRFLSICTSPLRVASTVTLTDVTVFYSFFQLKKLTRLHLDYFPISELFLEKLQQRVLVTRPY